MNATSIRRPVAAAGILGLACGALLFLTACGGIIDAQANAEWCARANESTVTVYPVHVVKGRNTTEHDAGLALRLAEFMERESLAGAALSESPVEFEFEPGMNQAAMLRRSAERFGARIAGSGIEADYALLVEILSNEDEDWIGGVHYYLVDRSGTIADAGLSNSHHGVFQRVDPKSREDGYAVAEAMLRESWVRPAGSEDQATVR